MPEENDQILDHLNKLTEAVNALSGKISEQDARLQKLETATVAPAQLSSEIPAPPSPPKAAGERIELAIPQPPQEKAAPLVDYAHIAAPKSIHQAYKEMEAKAAKPSEPKNLESEIGMKWLGRIGIIALIFGVAFFLKYAFDNNWIGPTGRVVLGIIVGLGLLTLGEFFRKKYAAFSQMLSGGGISILYLSIYAAFGFYDLIGQTPAFVAMAIITFISGALAVHAEAVSLAGIGILGGFLTPILLSTGVNKQIELFSYITLLDVGILAISFFRNWRGLSLIGLLGTAALFMGWFTAFYTNDQLFWTEFFLTIFFGIFAIATIAHNILARKKANGLDAALVSLNALGYFGISYFLLKTDYESFMGFFAVLMALLYFVLAWVSYRLNPEDKYLALFLPGLSVLFLTIAAPIQFDYRAVTIAWTIEGLILIWISFSLKNYSMRVFGWLVFFVAIFRMIVVDSFTAPAGDLTSIFNERFLAFAIGMVSAFVIRYFYVHNQSGLEPAEKGGKALAIVLMNLLFLWSFNAEIITYFNQKIAEAKYPDYPKCESQSFNNGRYVPSAYCEGEMRRYQETMEVHYKAQGGVRNAQNITLTIFWAIYAGIVVALGILKKSKAFRLAGIGLFALIIIKVFFYDLWSLGTLYRIIVSVTLGVVLLVASFMYNKYKDRIKEIL